MRSQVATPGGSRRYLIERELGRGGMGVVYQAFDKERGVRVALKALSQSDALNIYRLKNEFRQLSDLCHPNLVSLHELCCDADQWYFTMELIEGVTFDQYVGPLQHSQPVPVAQHPTLAGRARLLRNASVTLSQPGIGTEPVLPRLTCDLTRLRSALQQLVAAIGALHEAGKLHRDIKPSNVLVTAEGRVVVLDFGLVSNGTWVDAAVPDPDRTIGGSVFGTPAYMAPEQAAGEAVTTASDWYSVGSILYEALTGRLPFEGTVLQILRQKEALEPPPPSSVVSGVPEDLDELCRALLHRNPAERPTGEELRRSFLGSSVPPPLRDSLPENRAELFIGREPQLATLRAAFERSKEGHSQIVFVHGYSGMGKSALVRCMANDLIKRSEALVLRGRCYERESVPYKAFDDIIDALSRHMMRLPTEEASALLPRNVHSLARLFPVLKRVRAVAHARVPLHPTDDPQEMRHQAFGALKDLLLRLSDWQPLVINIDDLQWADVDSARMLCDLLGPPDPPPLLFIGVYRREAASTSAFLRHVLTDASLGGCSQQLAVDALSPEEAAQLAHELLGAQVDSGAATSAAISVESEGVPFFIGELTRHLRERPAHGPDSRPPVSLARVIASRTELLSDAARRVLEVLSVAARPVEQGVALQAAGLPTGDRVALQELRTARMVRTRGTRQADSAETYHDRVREAVVANLSAARIREIHARLAEATEEWGVGEPEQLIEHYTEAGEGRRAGETALQAADAAAEKLAFDRAADLYRRAIELLPETAHQRHCEITVRLGNALANGGRGALAAAAYLSAADSGAPNALVLRRKAARQLLRAGCFDTGFALARQLLQQVGVACPTRRSQLFASYVWTRAKLGLRGTHYERRKQPHTERLGEQRDVLGALYQELMLYSPLLAATLHARFLMNALDLGDERAVLEGLVWECIHLAMPVSGRSRTRARSLLSTVELMAQRDGSAYAQALHGIANAGTLLMAEARFADALEACRAPEAVLRTQCPGATWEASVLTMMRYACLEFAGDLGVLLREAPQRVREADERADRHSLAVLVQVLPSVHLMRDKPDAALAFLADHDAAGAEEFTIFSYLLMVRRIEVLLYQGQGAHAYAIVSEQWERLKTSTIHHSRFARASSHLLRARCALMAYWQTGDARVLGAVARDASACDELGPGFSGFRYALEAQLALVREDEDQARDRFEEAIKVLGAQQARRPQLYSQYRLGQLLRGGRGRHLQHEAASELSRQGIANVERWVSMQLPIEPAADA